MSLPDPNADGTGAPRHRSRRFLRSKRMLLASVSAVTLALGLSVPLALAAPSAHASVTSDSGFEAADGNLTVDGTSVVPPSFDWNGFAPTAWTGTAPYRTSTKVADGWQFGGFEDAQATTSDTGFAGGTKQDDNCATVNTGKAPNKDDLKRIYLASQTLPVATDGGKLHTFLNLAWVRIPQNTTSPSAHVGFEFNQGDTPCPGPNSDGLVERTAGDMLIVYDFTGGSTATPTITLRRWVTSGTCEVGSDSPPCWGPSTNLTDLGYAEARVNTSAVGPVTDAIAPSPPDNLGLNEFGEAGIDLTAAGVFSSNTCTAFGKALGVSRSSGNSATAQMKDLVGPGNFTIANCGQVIIRKVTSPSPDPTDTSFGYTTTGGLDPSTFSLKNGESQDYGSTVFAGSYSVTESDPGPNFKLTGLDCSASSTDNGTTITTDTATGKVSFDLKAQDVVDCTYTNTLQEGAIKITKTSIKGDTPIAGATFSITGPYSYSNSVTTGMDGTACVEGLPFGDYKVTETSAPTGYKIDDTSAHTVTVGTNTTCSGSPEEIPFTDTPLTDITATATSQVSGAGGTTSTITCVNDSSAGVGNSPQEGQSAAVAANGLEPGTYTCTIKIDP